MSRFDGYRDRCCNIALEGPGLVSLFEKRDQETHE